LSPCGQVREVHDALCPLRAPCFEAFQVLFDAHYDYVVASQRAEGAKVQSEFACEVMISATPAWLAYVQVRCQKRAFGCTRARACVLTRTHTHAHTVTTLVAFGRLYRIFATAQKTSKTYEPGLITRSIRSGCAMLSVRRTGGCFWFSKSGIADLGWHASADAPVLRSSCFSYQRQETPPPSIPRTNRHLRQFARRRWTRSPCRPVSPCSVPAAVRPRRSELQPSLRQNRSETPRRMAQSPMHMMRQFLCMVPSPTKQLCILLATDQTLLLSTLQLQRG
jgi:hypothetical protein